MGWTSNYFKKYSLSVFNKNFYLGLLGFIFKQINEKNSNLILILLLGLMASSILYLAYKFSKFIS